MLIRVRIVPNVFRDELAGQTNGVYKIRLTAPAIEGRANDALIRFLAKKIDIAPSQISLIKGHTSKHKTLEILAPDKTVEAALSEAAFC